MVKGLLDWYPEEGVELQHLVEKVDSFISRSFESLLEVFTRNILKASQVLVSLLISYVGDVIFSGGAQHLEDHCQLIVLTNWEAILLNASMLIRTQGEAGPTWKQRLPLLKGGGTLLHHSK